MVDALVARKAAAFEELLEATLSIAEHVVGEHPEIAEQIWDATAGAERIADLLGARTPPKGAAA